MQKKIRLVSQQDEENTKIYLMNKPHTKIQKHLREPKETAKKILLVSQREGSTRVYKSLMEPKQHMIK